MAKANTRSRSTLADNKQYEDSLTQDNNQDSNSANQTQVNTANQLTQANKQEGAFSVSEDQHEGDTQMTLIQSLDQV